MDYEKKYKDALDRARDLMTNQNPPAFDEHLIEIVFPELKESEDARIRKMLRAYIHDFGVPKEYFGDVETSDVLAWLEKQGEQKPADKVEQPYKVKPKFKVGAKQLDANEVIEWLQSFGLEIPTLIKSFKKNFSL